MTGKLATAADADDGTPALTRALAGGDEAAWREFHDSRRRRVRAYLGALWHGPEEALDDLVQETFLRAVRHMRVFPSDEVLWSWLAVLARSAAADAGRRRGRFRRFLDRFAADRGGLPATLTPDLEEALARLPGDAALLLRLKYEECRSCREIAAGAGLSEKAVESRLTRARKLLRELMNDS